MNDRCHAIATLALVLATGCSSSSPRREVCKVVPVTDTSRTAFVHLFEWKWTDIARECETYLGPKGFTAVQISPPNEHAWITSGDGAPYPWWMRYQPVSYRLDRSRSGTRDELADMVRRCAAVGVAIYVDAVINHMAPGAGARSSAGNHGWGPGNFPRVPYVAGHFHAPCAISDYRDASNVQYCQLLGLQDLDTGSDYVRDKLADYLVDLYELGVRGFRVDAAKHISASDLCGIVSEVESRTSEAPYWFLEVIGSPAEPIQPAQYFDISNGLVDVTEFEYGRRLAGAFSGGGGGGGGGRLADLRTFGEDLLPSERVVVFTDNHDKQRGHAGGGDYLTYHRGAAYALANVFMLAWPYGYPSLMSSYAFTADDAFGASHGPPHDPATGATLGPWDGGGAAPACFDQNRGGWVCEHRLRPIGNMVAFRAQAQGAPVVDWWDDTENRIAFGRGSAGFVVINADATPLSRTFQTSLAAGRYCDIISGEFSPGPGPGPGGPGACTGTAITVDATGKAAITVAPHTAAAIHTGARLEP